MRNLLSKMVCASLSRLHCLPIDPKGVKIVTVDDTTITVNIGGRDVVYDYTFSMGLNLARGQDN